MVQQLTPKEELRDCQISFKQLDQDWDGIITRKELIEGYKTYLDVDEEEVDRILLVADADGSGEIEYSEWMIATINK